MICKALSLVSCVSTPQEICSREDVSALISELGLIPKVSAEYRSFQKAMIESSFARKHFCDVYKDFLARQKSERDSLCLELYKRNKKFSRYVRSSVTNYTPRH